MISEIFLGLGIVLILIPLNFAIPIEIGTLGFIFLFIGSFLTLVNS